jgi:hypothetical protein
VKALYEARNTRCEVLMCFFSRDIFVSNIFGIGFNDFLPPLRVFGSIAGVLVPA